MRMNEKLFEARHDARTAQRDTAIGMKVTGRDILDMRTKSRGDQPGSDSKLYWN